MCSVCTLQRNTDNPFDMDDRTLRECIFQKGKGAECILAEAKIAFAFWFPASGACLFRAGSGLLWCWKEAATRMHSHGFRSMVFGERGSCANAFSQP